MATGFGIEWIKSNNRYLLLFKKAEDAPEKQKPSSDDVDTIKELSADVISKIGGSGCCLCQMVELSPSKSTYELIWHYFVCRTSLMRLNGKI